MNTRDRVVAALLRIYPAVWRREYGSELTHLLLSRPLRASVVANVIWSGVRERARGTVSGLGRVVAALLTMQLAVGFGSAARYLWGPGHDLPWNLREFASPFEAAVFGMVVATVPCAGVLCAVLLPATSYLETRREQLNWPGRILIGAALSPVAFLSLAIGVWLLGSGSASLLDTVGVVARFPGRVAVLLLAFAAGSVVLLARSDVHSSTEPHADAA